MSDPQGISFIPKQPTGGSVRKRTVRKVYVLAYISFVLFLGTLVAAGGTFIYKLSVESTLEEQQNKLIEERDQFSPAQIESLRALDTRLEEAQGILDGHISVHRIFEVLEAVTVSTVQIVGFDIMRTDSGSVELIISGLTKEGFEALLFQKEISERDSIFNDAVYSEIVGTVPVASEDNPVSADDPLEVNFTLAVTLSSDEVGYSGSPVIESVDTDSASSAELTIDSDDLNEEVSSESLPVNDTIE